MIDGVFRALPALIPLTVMVVCVIAVRKLSRRSPLPDGLPYYPSTANGAFAPTPNPGWSHEQELDEENSGGPR
jgi:hypothetical protein